MEEKEGEDIIKNVNNTTQPRSPSNRTGIQNNTSYKNSNYKSTKSKYNISSSMKKKSNQNKDYTIESDIRKPLFNNCQEGNKNIHILETNIMIQNKLLEEYQKWVNVLLSVIDHKKINKTYNDIGTPIQERLESLEKLKDENFKTKILIINTKVNNESIEKNLDKKRKTQNMVIKEFNEKDKSNGLNIKKEKEQLISNVQMLANELDDLTENNNQLYNKIQKNNKLKDIYDLIEEKNNLKEENKILKKVMILKSRKNYIDLKESLSQDNNGLIDLAKKKNGRKINIYNSNNISNREFGSIGPITGYGEYKLEKEENINTHESLFFCGL
jgi:hypothetical protein